MNKHIITEISPLSEKDCLFIVERYKTEFTYPLHNHKEYELNFVENGAGVRRIVGDSVEEIGDYDLVLLCGDNLEHVWEQGNCQSKQIREITIQFSPDLFSNNFIDKKQFTSIRKMLDRAQKGLSFPLHAVMKVYSTIDSLLKGEPGFYQFVKFLTILYELSICDDAHSYSSVFIDEQYFVKFENSSMLCSQIVDKQFLSIFYLELLSLNLNNNVHCIFIFRSLCRAGSTETPLFEPISESAHKSTTKNHSAQTFRRFSLKKKIYTSTINS